MKKKVWFLIAALVTLLAVVTFWLISTHTSKSKDEIRIGVLLPLTGGAASLGKAALHGMETAISEYNAKRNPSEPQIRLVVEDTKAAPAVGVSAFQKLLTSDKVCAVLGPLASGVTLAVAPLAERNQIVILSPGASAPSITYAGDYVFRNELSEEFGARMQARLAFEKLGFRSIALLYINNEYGVGTTKVFKEQFTELGGRILADEAFEPGTTDYRTLLTKIKSEHPDAMFVVYQDDIVNIIRQCKDLGISIPIFTTPVFENPENLTKLGALAEGVIYTFYGTFQNTATSGAAGEFVKAYRNRYGSPPTYYAALGYDAANLLIEALRSADFDTDLIKEHLYKIRNYPGVTGNTTVDENGDVSKPVSLKIVRGGRFVPY